VRLCGTEITGERGARFLHHSFHDDYSLDADDLALLISKISAFGVSAVVCAGGVGEFYALERDEYRQEIRTAVRAAAGRVPVLVGIGHSTRTACELARFADAEGASGLMVHLFYFLSPRLKGFCRHYQALGESSGLGLIAFSTGQIRLFAGVDGVSCGN
jgi:5-dehydro-4-deoxyglucarate dehydratase